MHIHMRCDIPYPVCYFCIPLFYSQNWIPLAFPAFFQLKMNRDVIFLAFKVMKSKYARYIDICCRNLLGKRALDIQAKQPYLRSLQEILSRSILPPTWTIHSDDFVCNTNSSFMLLTTEGSKHSNADMHRSVPHTNIGSVAFLDCLCSTRYFWSVFLSYELYISSNEKL